MSILLNEEIAEGSTAGFKATIYDTNSDVVIPASLDWSLYDSLGSNVTSDGLSSLSSESLIVLNSSVTLVVSGETRPKLKRVLSIDATYNSSELGNGVRKKESFEFTLVNNPGGE